MLFTPLKDTPGAKNGPKWLDRHWHSAGLFLRIEKC
jgi:hypothetical protein